MDIEEILEVFHIQMDSFGLDRMYAKSQMDLFAQNKYHSVYSLVFCSVKLRHLDLLSWAL